MSFLESIKRAEDILFGQTKHELLELSHTPYSFGSGFGAYRIMGADVRIVFDGKDNIWAIDIAEGRQTYPRDSWETLWHGQFTEIEAGAIPKLKSR